MGLDVQPPVGAPVRLTAQFVRSGGNPAVEAALRWTVQECDCHLCSGGRFVAVEPYTDAFRAEVWGDRPEPRRPRFLHHALSNLELVPRASGDASTESLAKRAKRA